jgi:hypothetical protein
MKCALDYPGPQPVHADSAGDGPGRSAEAGMGLGNKQWRGLVWLLAAAVSGLGCGTVMSDTRLTTPAVAERPELRVRVSHVQVSERLRREEFTQASRVLVVLDIEALAATQLDLRSAVLSISGGPPSETARSALASGLGEPSGLLRDGEHAGVLALRAGQHVRAWVAFGGFAARTSREIPERVELSFPNGLQLTLSRPGAAPLWVGRPVTTSAGIVGLWVQGSADEGAVNATLGDFRGAAGPLVLGFRYGVGIRDAQPRSAGGPSIVGVNLALAADLAWPVLRTRMLIIAPYVGAEAAWLLGKDEITRRNWFGPSLGLQFAIHPLLPLHGPFPITYPRSLLGAQNFQIGLVHWFGPDRSPPSFGVSASVSSAWED